MALDRDAVRGLADQHYLYDQGYETDDEKLFGLLVDVADTYVAELERLGSDEPAPFMGATPQEAAINGLRENLDLLRGNR